MTLAGVGAAVAAACVVGSAAAPRFARDDAWRWFDDPAGSGRRAWLPARGAPLDGAGVALPCCASSFFGEPPFLAPGGARLAVVLHGSGASRAASLRAAHGGWLAHVWHVIAAEATDAALGTVGFPSMPRAKVAEDGAAGELVAHYKYARNGSRWPYLGAHRPLAAILYANDAARARARGRG